MTMLDHPVVHRLVGSAVSPAADAQRDPDPYGHSGWLTVERAVCLLAIFLLAWRLVLRGGMTLGFLFALLLCPIWIGVMRRYRHGTLLFCAAGLTYLAGLVLTAFAKNHHRFASMHSVISDTSLWIGIFAGIGVLLWARTILDLKWIGLMFGLGMLLRGLTHPEELAPTNPWKFVYAMPLTVIALGFTSAKRSRAGSLIVLLVLAAASAALDSRSMFGALLLAAILVGWQLRPRSGSRPLAWGWTLALLCGLAGAVYNLATSLMLEGFLGQEVQQRSEVQVQTAGSLILGGRPELSATLALLRHGPAGFGVGVAPNIYDVMTAKAGMIKINYDPDNGYVEKYMFGGHVELHSTAGDLWAVFGIPGLALAALIALLCVRGISHSISRREGNGLLIFAACNTLWNLPFSPLYSSVPMLMLTLGLVLSNERPSAAEELALPAMPASHPRHQGGHAPRIRGGALRRSGSPYGRHVLPIHRPR